MRGSVAGWLALCFVLACSSDKENGVTPPPGGPAVAAVQVVPSSADLTPAGTRQFSATARDASGNPVTTTFTWSSTSDAVATVNGSGMVSAVSAGSAQIRATASNGIFGEGSVTVTAPPPPEFRVAVSQNTSATTSAPTVTVQVPAGQKVIGCGARTLYATGTSGVLLTAVYPSDSRSCTARARDHIQPAQGAVQIWAFAVVDPNEEWDVLIVNQTTPGVSATAVLPAGYTLTGGGGQIEFQGAGALLTSTRPVGSSWVVNGKEHLQADATAVTTSYAIGIRPRNGAAAPASQVTVEQLSGVQSRVAVASGYTLVGGGATIAWGGQGRLLTGTYPDADNWLASGKEHIVNDNGTITAYAIGVRTP